MNRFLLLAAATSLAACAGDLSDPAATSALDGFAAAPKQTLVLTNLGVSEHGRQFGWRVTGAQPGQQVLVMAANGGISNNGGTCANALGGNCADILPGTLGYQVAASGTANAQGKIVRGMTLPTSIAPGDYQFQAFVLSPNNNGNESNTTETTVVPGCANDAFEANNSIATAAPLPSSGSSAVICDTDVDVFELTVESGATVEIGIDYNASLGDIDMDLVDVNGTVLDSSGSLTDHDYVLWRNNGATETVYVRMYSFVEPDVAGSPYTITTEFAIPSVCTDDAAEDDDTAATAQVVGAGLHAAQSCDGDDDWYRISVGAGEQLAATASANPSDGDVRLSIYANNGNTLVSGLSSSERYTAQTAQNLWVRVVLQSDSVDGGGAPYDLNLSVVTQQVCPVDSFENNDSSNNASPITPGLHPGLGACFNDSDWYSIPVVVGVDPVVYVSVLFDGADADLDAVLYNTNGQEVARSESESSNENLSANVTATGNYLLHVYVWNGSADGAPTIDGAVYDLDIYTN